MQDAVEHFGGADALELGFGAEQQAVLEHGGSDGANVVGAALSARDFVSPDDIRAVASPVLEHRLLLRPESELEGVRTAEVLDRILHEVPVPR